MQSNPSFESFLKQRWSEVYKSHDAKLIFRGDVEKVEVKRAGKLLVILNESLKKKRASQVDDKKESVFQNFQAAKFNFNKVPEKEILFYVNVDSEEIITKQKAIENGSKFLDADLEEADEQSENHPIVINTSPVYRNHSLLIMFPESELPQVVGQEVLLLVLILCKMSPTLTIGFNSLGGAASVNHLHFQLAYIKDLVGTEKMPIETSPRKELLRTTLVNPKEEINMYTVGVVIEELDGPVKGFVLSPSDPKADQSETSSSLSFVFGLLINEILDKNIAHNILICEGGKRIYVLPRKFATAKNQSGWLEMAGVEVVTDEAKYNSFKEEDWLKSVGELQIDTKTLQQIVKGLKGHLSQYS